MPPVPLGRAGRREHQHLVPLPLERAQGGREASDDAVDLREERLAYPDDPQRPTVTASRFAAAPPGPALRAVAARFLCAQAYPARNDASATSVGLSRASGSIDRGVSLISLTSASDWRESS